MLPSNVSDRILDYLLRDRNGNNDQLSPEGVIAFVVPQVSVEARCRLAHLVLLTRVSLGKSGFCRANSQSQW